MLLKPIAICVPARDEATELPGLFQALQALIRDPRQTVHVCLLLDRCTDESAALAASFRARSPYPIWVERSASSTGNAGIARHHAMMIGSRAIANDHGILLTTDADSRPASNWLAAMAKGLSCADLVLGRVVRTGAQPNPLQDRIERYYDGLFALRRHLDPLPWEAATIHHQASGANMGIAAGAYRMLGGFASIASGEDSRLADDASRAGMRVRRDADSLVYTSDRREGRAVDGMAATLQRLDRGDPAMVSVAHPVDAAWQYRLQGIARAAYANDRLGIVAAAIGVSDDHVRGVARDCPNSEAFAMRIVPTPPGGMRYVVLPVAERELAKLLAVRAAA